MTAVDPYIRRIRPVRVYDGDTITVDVDLGYGVTSRHSIRVLGVNCPELRSGDDREAGLAARMFTVGWIDAAVARATDAEWPLLMRSEKADKYGRYLGDVYTYRDEHLTPALLDSGNGVPYP